MNDSGSETQVSKGSRWTGSILSALPALLFLFSGGMKFTQTQQVLEGFTHLGLPERLAVPLGIVEVASTIIYLVPRTAVLGAVLLTGYMGGAIAAHARIGEPFVVQAALGVIVWLGLYLRDARLRVLLPLRKPISP